MISAGSRVQLEMLVDTCGQGKDLTNIQTRGMLAMLATFMLSSSSEENNSQTPGFYLSENKFMEIIRNLEEKIN